MIGSNIRSYAGIHVGFILVIICCCGQTEGNDKDELQKLQEGFWDWRMLRNPTSSTWNGMCKYNDKIESYDIANFDIARNKTEEFMRNLTSINRANLDQSGRVNYDIPNDTLQTFLDGNLWARYGALTPVNFLGGIQLYSGPVMADSNTRGDFENYIARLNAVQKQVDEIKVLCSLAISLNRTLNNVSMARLPAQFDRKIFDNPENSSYFEPFGDRLNSNFADETDRENIRNRGRAAVIAYMDAFRDLKTFVINEYMPNTRKAWGVDSWDPSHAYYKACLKWHLSFEMSPDDVHNKGLEEVARISTDMQKILNKLQFSGSVGEFFNSLEGDPRFYSNDTEELLDKYRSTLFDRIQPKLSSFFRDIPNIPIKIEATDSDGIGGGYSSATETSAGVFSINLFRPMEVWFSKWVGHDNGGEYEHGSTGSRVNSASLTEFYRPFFEMMALTLHEANPGHHLQHSYAMEAHLPEFRKNPILNFANVPNWYPFYSSYQEGWALYTEYLGEEMGLYATDYEMMGRYSYEILRACRLVVDTGLHYLGWSRQEAIYYLTNHTALATGSAENEIDRYITWPGQACAYKVGELKIKELRQRAATQLGSKFDIKDFHLLILQNGGMPMNILDTMVTDWIKDTNAKEPTSGSTIITSSLTLSLFQVAVCVAALLLC